MLIGGMVQNHLDDDADAAGMGAIEKGPEVVQIAITRMDRRVVGDVIAVIAKGRWEERHEPDCVDPELLHVVQPLCQASEIADSVVVRVDKGSYVDLVDNRFLVPARFAI